MPIDLEHLRERIQELSDQADDILSVPQNDASKIRREYQTWYSQVRVIVAAHLPERLTGLSDLYLTPKPIYPSYRGTSSYLTHSPKNRGLFEADMGQQRGILLAVPDVIELRALEVAALVTSDLVHGELNEARLLLKHGFTRAAGAVAGVALEAHLKLLHTQSNLTHTDKDSIVPLATRLRQNDSITLGDEKKCIAMSDTRNKCDHKKKDDPSKEEVEELIDDVDRFTKRVQIV